MKSLLSTLALGCLAAANAQQWSLVAPIPTSRNLNGIAFANPNRGMIVGDGKAFLQTEDGGASWRKAAASPVSSIQAGFWLDTQNAWVVGSDGPNDSFRTTDGGSTWTKMSGMPFGSYYAVVFKNPSLGYVVGNGGAALTKDGGNTWAMTPYYALNFVDTQTGFGWNDNGIYRTTNGGTSWQQKTTFSAYPVSVTASIFVAAGANGVVRSTDGGQTWTQVSNLGGYGLPVVLSPNNIVCTNNTGNSIYSTNGGVTWTAVIGQCPQGILKAVRVNDTTVCAISATGDVYRSTNSGASWKLVQEGQGVGPVSWDITMVDETTGFAAGQNGIIMRTTNGGASWNAINNGTGLEINSIRFGANGVMLKSSKAYVDRSFDGGNFWNTQRVKNFGLVFGHDETIEEIDVDKNSGFGVAAGFGGTLFRTIDNGATWQSVGFPAISEGVYFYSVKVIDSHTAYAGGQDFDELDHTKSLYKTTDAGLTWQMVFPSGLRWIKIEYTDPLHGMMLNLGKLVYRTSDGGQTWQTGQLTGALYSNLDLDMANQNVAYMTGWDGYIAKTVDGGATWNQLPTGTTSTKFMDVEAVSATEVWVIGQETNGSYLWHTINGGQNWTREPIPNPGVPYFYISELHLMPDGSLMVGGFDGVVMKRTDVTAVSPTGLTIFRGNVVSGGLPEIVASDDQRLNIRPGLTISSVESPVTVLVDGIAPTANPSSLTVRVESQVSASNLQQTIDLFDYAANEWVTVDTRNGSVNSDAVVTAPGANSARFVQTGTRAIRARVRVKAVGPVVSYPWQARIDQVSWSVSP